MEGATLRKETTLDTLWLKAGEGVTHWSPLWYDPTVFEFLNSEKHSKGSEFKHQANRRGGYANYIYLMRIFWNQKIYTYHPAFKVDQLAALPRNSRKDPKLTKDLRKLTASFMGRWEMSTAGLY